MKRILLLLLIPVSLLVRADEGMWLPQLLGQLNEKQMKSLGMKISAGDIYNINRGSLKDAIVSFGGFCTAEVISDKGLILTNHHCGYDVIQNHSTVERNYLASGFWAADHGEELPNAGLTATFIIRIEDVTGDVLKGVTASMDESARQSQIDRNINAVRANKKIESWQAMFVRPFYYGNKYYLFVTETYRDVRLVGAPPSSIGKFGADTDNWMWPRHTGDFALFRIYAGKDNRPADYSPDNLPYKPKHSLSISLDGVAENDFTMVFGFPGRTQEYLPAEAMRQVAEVLNPVKIGIREKTLAVWDGHMRSSEQVKIQYSSKYASMSNAWKKWIGESGGIVRTGAVAKRLAFEEEYRKRLNKDASRRDKYGDILDMLIEKYRDMEPYALSRDRIVETVNAIELFAISSQLRRVARSFASQGETGYIRTRDSVLWSLTGFFRDYRSEIDRQVFTELLRDIAATDSENPDRNLWLQGQEPEAVAERVFGRSALYSLESIKSLLAADGETAMNRLNQDPAMIYTGNIIEYYQQQVAPQVNRLQNDINQLQRGYMQAQMELFPERNFYPDANSTMRVTYGQVKGYRPRDAVRYDYYTYLDGVMEKYIPGDYEFDIPEKLISLYKAKDYGRYGVNGRMPVCFIGTNHTTGGNSGSPALDAYGNLVGLNFDRVWEGTMSDLNYDPSICRNIMVDARYILFIIDKFAGAGHLISEMKLVHPRKTKS